MELCLPAGCGHGPGDGRAADRRRVLRRDGGHGPGPDPRLHPPGRRRGAGGADGRVLRGPDGDAHPGQLRGHLPAAAEGHGLRAGRGGGGRIRPGGSAVPDGELRGEEPGEGPGRGGGAGCDGSVCAGQRGGQLRAVRVPSLAEPGEIHRRMAGGIRRARLLHRIHPVCQRLRRDHGRGPSGALGPDGPHHRRAGGKCHPDHRGADGGPGGQPRRRAAGDPGTEPVRRGGRILLPGVPLACGRRTSPGTRSSPAPSPTG